MSTSRSARNANKKSSTRRAQATDRRGERADDARHPQADHSGMRRRSRHTAVNHYGAKQKTEGTNSLKHDVVPSPDQTFLGSLLDHPGSRSPRAAGERTTSRSCSTPRYSTHAVERYGARRTATQQARLLTIPPRSGAKRAAPEFLPRRAPGHRERLLASGSPAYSWQHDAGCRADGRPTSSGMSPTTSRHLRLVRFFRARQAGASSQDRDISLCLSIATIYSHNRRNAQGDLLLYLPLQPHLLPLRPHRRLELHTETVSLLCTSGPGYDGPTGLGTKYRTHSAFYSDDASECPQVAACRAPPRHPLSSTSQERSTSRGRRASRTEQASPSRRSREGRPSYFFFPFPAGESSLLP